MAGCARTNALAEHLWRHAEAGNAEGACVRYSRRVPKSTRGSKIIPPPLMLACRGKVTCRACSSFSRRVPISVLPISRRAGPVPTSISHMATTNDREACVRALIKEGANVDAFSCRGHTPLMIHDSVQVPYYDAIITRILFDANEKRCGAYPIVRYTVSTSGPFLNIPNTGTVNYFRQKGPVNGNGFVSIVHPRGRQSFVAARRTRPGAPASAAA